MDKDQNIEDAEAQNEETSNELTATDHQETTNQTVVVKKSGGGLALLLSVVALALSGYLFYKDWLSTTETARQKRAGELLEQMKSTGFLSNRNSEQFKQQINALDQTITQIKSDLDGLKKDTKENISKQLPSNEFDNTDNEVAIQRLQSQLASQAHLIEALQAQLAEPANIQSVGNLPNNDFDALQKNRVIQSLGITQTLLDTGQISAAVSSLENLKQSTSLEFNDRNQLQSIIDKLEQTPQPDVAALKQRLSTANATIQTLQLPVTDENDETEAKWYERFVSVKKIEADQGLESTFELLSMKSQLSHLLQSAELLLNLHNEAGWQQSLLQAADLLQQQMPKQQDLITELQRLSAEPIKAKVPDNLGLNPLVEELKRSF